MLYIYIYIYESKLIKDDSNEECARERVQLITWLDFWRIKNVISPNSFRSKPFIQYERSKNQIDFVLKHLSRMNELTMPTMDRL